MRFQNGEPIIGLLLLSRGGSTCTFFSFSAAFFSAAFFSVTFLAGCLGGETLVLLFFKEDTAATGAAFGMTLLVLEAALELERGGKEVDLFTLATLFSTLRAAFWSRLRIWTFGTDLLVARDA